MLKSKTRSRLNQIPILILKLIKKTKFVTAHFLARTSLKANIKDSAIKTGSTENQLDRVHSEFCSSIVNATEGA